MTTTFLILGGYGNTGSLIARYLLQETDARLILAGRHPEKAEAMAGVLNQRSGGHRVTAMRVDAADPRSVRAAFAQADLVVVASSTAEYVATLARAALAEQIDYLDLQYSVAKVATLQAMRAEIEAAGCCFITDAG